MDDSLIESNYTFIHLLLSSNTDFYGVGGVSSDRQCYEEFNTKGSMSGHCGMIEEAGTTTYLKCDQKWVFQKSLQKNNFTLNILISFSPIETCIVDHCNVKKVLNILKTRQHQDILKQ